MKKLRHLNHLFETGFRFPAGVNKDSFWNWRWDHLTGKSSSPELDELVASVVRIPGIMHHMENTTGRPNFTFRYYSDDKVLLVIENGDTGFVVEIEGRKHIPALGVNRLYELLNKPVVFPEENNAGETSTLAKKIKLFCGLPVGIEAELFVYSSDFNTRQLNTNGLRFLKSMIGIDGDSKLALADLFTKLGACKIKIEVRGESGAIVFIYGDKSSLIGAVTEVNGKYVVSKNNGQILELINDLMKDEDNHVIENFNKQMTVFDVVTIYLEDVESYELLNMFDRLSVYCLLSLQDNSKLIHSRHEPSRLMFPVDVDVLVYNFSKPDYVLKSLLYNVLDSKRGLTITTKTSIPGQELRRLFDDGIDGYNAFKHLADVDNWTMGKFTFKVNGSGFDVSVWREGYDITFEFSILRAYR